MRKAFSILCLLAVVLCSCKEREVTPYIPTEDRAAKANMQGIWLDEDTREVFLKAKGDTIYHADQTSQPTYFRIITDSLQLGDEDNKYEVVKLTPNLLWFKNRNGDLVKLMKSETEADSLEFTMNTKILSVTEVVKKDSVIIYNGERYHLYIAVNPTKYRVVRSSYTDDGVEVETIYYDNIIHISVYQGKKRIYSNDIRKEMFSELIPERFLSQSILGNVDFGRVDSKGFHFPTSVCIPDGASCYMVDTCVDFEGNMRQVLVEY